MLRGQGVVVVKHFCDPLSVCFAIEIPMIHVWIFAIDDHPLLVGFFKKDCIPHVVVLLLGPL